MKNTATRIKEIADNKGISLRKLEIIIGASNGIVSNAIKKERDIQSKWLSEIIYNFSDINSEWLLTGKGEMLKKDVPIYKEEKKEDCSVFKLELGYLKKDNERLENLLLEKDKVIKLLERELTHKKTQKFIR